MVCVQGPHQEMPKKKETEEEQPAFPDYRSRWQPGHHSQLNVCVFVQ